MNSPRFPSQIVRDDEIVLVASAQNGDPAAFEELVSRYQSRIYRLTQTITGNREDGEDGMQEAFLKAYVHLRGFRGSYRCLGPMGRLAIYGFSAAAGPEGKRSLLGAAKAFLAARRYHPLKLMENNTAVIGVHFGHLDARSAVLAKELAEVFRLCSAGKIKPVIGKTVALEEAAAAHRYIHSRQNVGKVVLRVA